MKLSAVAHILYLQIGAVPVPVSNPRVVELIRAGLVVETAPRVTACTGGLSVTTFTVRRA